MHIALVTPRLSILHTTTLAAAAIVLATTGCVSHSPDARAVAVPDVVGLTGDEAIARICDAGLRPVPRAPTTAQTSRSGGWTTVAPWRPDSQPVTASDPAAGASAVTGQMVVLRYRDPNTGAPLALRDSCP